MTTKHLPATQNLLAISAKHLQLEPVATAVEHYHQQWSAAQSSGNRLALQAIRQEVVMAGRRAQAHLSNPGARALWLALLQLRCSMVMPRARF